MTESSVTIMTMDELFEKQEQEMKKLEEECKLMLKNAKKSNKAEIETKINQMEYDLKVKHIEEQNILEEALDKLDATEISALEASRQPSTSSKSQKLEDSIDKAAIAESKKAKAQKKKNMKAMKEAEKEAAKAEMRSETHTSQREVELQKLNIKLGALGLKIKEVLSDGNCLYRAISDQLEQIHQKNPQHQPDVYDFLSLKRIAANYIRSNREEFAPFLGFESSSREFDEYCQKVESPSSAEWGGQIEIRALANSLNRPIIVYDADSPTLTMGEFVNNDESVIPIQLSFHRHYYALGEHYNSVEMKHGRP